MNNITENKELLNIIAPINLEYKNNYIIVGEKFVKIYTIIKYPTSLNIGWLSDICNIKNTITVKYFSSSDDANLINAMSKGIKQAEQNYQIEKDILQKNRYLKEIEDGEEILKKIDSGNEQIGYMNILILVVAESLEELIRTSKQVENKLCGMQIKVRALSSLMKESLESVSPFSDINPIINNISRRNIFFKDFIGGIPFVQKAIRDKKGIILGKDINDSMIILDIWNKDINKNNYNFVINGTSGIGKSTASYHLCLQEYLRGTNILVIDPERRI